jgi:hypothetical protein
MTTNMPSALTMIDLSSMHPSITITTDVHRDHPHSFNSQPTTTKHRLTGTTNHR